MLALEGVDDGRVHMLLAALLSAIRGHAGDRWTVSLLPDQGRKYLVRFSVGRTEVATLDRLGRSARLITDGAADVSPLCAVSPCAYHDVPNGFEVEGRVGDLLAVWAVVVPAFAAAVRAAAVHHALHRRSHSDEVVRWIDAHEPVHSTALERAATERLSVARLRIGQGRFRECLIREFGGRCAVTGLAVPELLVASHIKPWADASDTERVDPANGLLLCANVDVLFDRGLVSFDDGGVLLPAGELGAEARQLLGLSHARSLPTASTRRREFLAWHRRWVWRQ